MIQHPPLRVGGNPTTVRFVIDAIQCAGSIEIKYQSLSRPEPIWRWIAPHAIAFDGFRWHTRAYCLTDNCFKDFLLSRILKTRDSKPCDVSPTADIDWVEEVTLEIAPHPALSEMQRQVIELDYGMVSGRAVVTVRRALLYYAMKRLGLDSDPASRKPEEQQIILLSSSADLRRTGMEI